VRAEQPQRHHAAERPAHQGEALGGIGAREDGVERGAEAAGERLGAVERFADLVGIGLGGVAAARHVDHVARGALRQLARAEAPCAPGAEEAVQQDDAALGPQRALALHHHAHRGVVAVGRDARRRNVHRDELRRRRPAGRLALGQPRNAVFRAQRERAARAGAEQQRGDEEEDEAVEATSVFGLRGGHGEIPFVCLA
jgi:hypothetical protein